MAEEHSSEESSEKELTVKKVDSAKDLKTLSALIVKAKQVALLPGSKSDETLFEDAGIFLSVDGKSVHHINVKLNNGLSNIFDEQSITKITYDYKSVLKEISAAGDY